MLLLKVDKTKCVDCGNCEALLPGLIHKMQGRLMISERSFERESKKITRAIETCYLDCITVEPGEPLI